MWRWQEQHRRNGADCKVEASAGLGRRKDIQRASNDEECLRGMRSWLISRAAAVVEKHNQEAETPSSETARVVGFPCEGFSLALQQQLGETAEKNLLAELRGKNIPHQVFRRSRTSDWKAISGVRIIREIPLRYLNL